MTAAVLLTMRVSLGTTMIINNCRTSRRKAAGPIVVIVIRPSTMIPRLSSAPICVVNTICRLVSLNSDRMPIMMVTLRNNRRRVITAGRLRVCPMPSAARTYSPLRAHQTVTIWAVSWMSCPAGRVAARTLLTILAVRSVGNAVGRGDFAP